MRRPHSADLQLYLVRTLVRRSLTTTSSRRALILALMNDLARNIRAFSGGCGSQRQTLLFDLVARSGSIASFRRPLFGLAAEYSRLLVGYAMADLREDAILQHNEGRGLDNLV